MKNHEDILIEIKCKINKYFENIGRQVLYDSEEMRINLIDDIDDLVNTANLDKKKLILKQIETGD